MPRSIQVLFVFLAIGAGCVLMPGTLRADDTGPGMEQGLRELEAGRPAEAVRIFSGLIEKEPTAELYYQRAVAYGRQHEYQQAMEDLTAAVTLAPQQPSYHLQQGRLLLTMGRQADAVQAFTKAIELDQGNARALGLRARSYFLQGNASKGLPDVQAAIQLNPDRGSWYVLEGDILGTLGEHGKAVQDYDRALQLHPGDAVAHNNRGIALANLGKTRDAIEDMNQAMDIASSASASGNGQSPSSAPW